MKVLVRTYGNLRRYLPDHQQGAPVEVEDSVTVGALLAALGIPESEAWRVSRNGGLVDLDEMLFDGDQVSVFAPVGGG